MNTAIYELLGEQYRNAIFLEGWAFFSSLADYAKYIITTPNLNEIIVNDILPNQILAFQKFQELKDRVNNEFRAQHEAILLLISDNKISSKEIESHLNLYNYIKKGKYLTPQTTEEKLKMQLDLIINTIYRNKPETVADLLETDPIKKIKNPFKGIPSFGEYLDERDRLAAEQQITIWGAWDKVNYLYMLIYKHDELQKQYTDQKDYRLHFYLSDYPEIQAIKAGNKYKITEFIKEKYTAYFTKLHFYFLEKLKSLDKNLIVFPFGQTVLYKEGKVYFATVSDIPEMINFTTAPTEREVFDCLWELRLANPKEIKFSKQEIHERYKAKYKDEISPYDLAHGIGNIKKRVKGNSLLKERFILRSFGRDKGWEFSLS